MAHGTTQDAMGVDGGAQVHRRDPFPQAHVAMDGCQGWEVEDRVGGVGGNLLPNWTHQTPPQGKMGPHPSPPIAAAAAAAPAGGVGHEAGQDMHVDVPSSRTAEGEGPDRNGSDDREPTSEGEEEDEPMEGPPGGEEEEEEEPPSNEDPNVAKGGFTWRIPGFSMRKERKIYSDTFQVGGYQWYEKKKKKKNQTRRGDPDRGRNEGRNET
eukprot:scaffold544_cov320-Pavlova_lutheri.AAC.6